MKTSIPKTQECIVDLFFEGRKETLKVMEEGKNVVEYLLRENRICPLIDTEIKFIRKLGQGKYGAVFEITFPGQNLGVQYAVKKTVSQIEEDPCIHARSYARTDGKGETIVPKGSYVCRNDFTEYIIAFTVADLLKSGTSINFIDVFYFSTCPSKEEITSEQNLASHYTFMEKVDGSLFDLYSNGKILDLSEIFFQIIHSIAVYQEKYKIVHGDLHESNIFIKFNEKDTPREYKVGKNSFYISTSNIVKIGDWGLSVLYGGDKGRIIGDRNTLKYGYAKKGEDPMLPNFYNEAYDIAHITLRLYILEPDNKLIKDTLAWILQLSPGYTKQDMEDEVEMIYNKKYRPEIDSLEAAFSHVSPLKILANVRGFSSYLMRDKEEFVEAARVENNIVVKPPVIVREGHSGEKGYVTKVNGEFHSIRDEPLITNSGTQVWYKNGQYHRDGDKPAFIGSKGEIRYYKNNVVHRLNKPAIINADGTEEFWEYGEQVYF